MISSSASPRASTAARTFSTISAAVDHLLALHVAAALRRDLVLDVQRGDPGRGVLAHRAHHVERVAVAVVGVGDQRHAHRLREPPRVAGHLVEREQADVGPAEQRGRRAEAGHVDGGEAGALDQPRRQRVVRAGGQHRLRAGEQLAEGRHRGHGYMAGMSPVRQDVTVVGRRLEPEDHRLRDFLTRVDQAYAWVEAGTPEADALLASQGFTPADLPLVLAPTARCTRRHGRARGGRLARERPAAARALRPRDRGRRPGRAGGRGLRRLGRALDAAGRARRPGRPGLPHLQDRELLRLPGRHRGRAPRAAGGPPGRGLRRRAGAAARRDRQPDDARGRAARHRRRLRGDRRRGDRRAGDGLAHARRRRGSRPGSAAASTTAPGAARPRAAAATRWSSSARATRPARRS